MTTVSEVQTGSAAFESIKIETGAEIVFRDMFKDKAFVVLEEDNKIVSYTLQELLPRGFVL